MSDITTLFFDIGGVVLSDGWDRDIRRLACEKFGLDFEELQSRHQPLADSLETGQIDLSDYLDRVVFNAARAFSKAEFADFIRAQSLPNLDTLALVSRLAGKGNYLLCAINNESLELNCYRIGHYGLGRYFSAFFSSCFLGLKKPGREIYVRALQITQRLPQKCLFVDDRESNLESPKLLGMQTIHYRDSSQLQEELRVLGIEVPA